MLISLYPSIVSTQPNLLTGGFSEIQLIAKGQNYFVSFGDVQGTLRRVGGKNSAWDQDLRGLQARSFKHLGVLP